jgi:hypothetical protein
MSLAHRKQDSERKSRLLAIGQWALASGRGWLVRAARAAMRREGLDHA